jgi:crotonobetainyl-CoA:carnitine CoA-transferase CaiB-like acyl-CoA transferase
VTDPEGKPLDGLTAKLADSLFATQVAGWWLATLGADVESSLTSGPTDADLGDVVCRFLARGVKRTTGADADVIVGHGGEAQGSSARTAVWSSSALTAAGDGMAAEQTLWAETGMADLTRELQSHADSGDPCVPSNRQPAFLTGTMMAVLALAARIATLQGGEPPARMVVDPRNLLALLPMQPLARAQLAPGPTVVRSATVPGGVFDALDGPLYARAVEPDHWRELLRRIPGLGDPTGGPFLGWDPGAVDTALAAWVKDQPREDVVALLQGNHIPAASVRSVAQVLDDPHLVARRFATRGTDPEIRPPWMTLRQGEGSAPPPAGSPSPRLPLAGVRVLDLSWAWAGPFATRLLADLGAEIFNIEWYPRASNLRTQAPFASRHPRSPNAGGWWSSNQRGKHSIGVNLKHPEGRALVLKLAETCHLTIENFAVGVVERLGLTYDDVATHNPAIVYVSMSGWGRHGPSEHWIGYGTHVQAGSGSYVGTPAASGGPSHMMIPYADPVSGLCAALGAVTYLYASLATGRSVHLDVAELECMALALLEPLVEAAAGEEPTRYPYRIVPDGESFRLYPSGAPAGHPPVPVQTMADVLADERFRAYWIEDRTEELRGDRLRIAGPPWTIDGQPVGSDRGAPTLFADTRSVLQNVLGLSESEISELIESEAIAVEVAG